MPSFTPRVTLNLGMGFDSCFFAVDFLESPKSKFRHLCEPEELVVISSQTGNESKAVKYQMETYIYPILRKHGIRTIQIARASSSLRDGFVILDDTNHPKTCYIRPTTEKPYWSLGDDLLSAASVPQVMKGTRTCSDKYKIKILDKWHQLHCPGCSRVIGFNASESDRIAKDPCQEIIGFNASELDRIDRKEGFKKKKKIQLGHLNIYPLYDEGYTRSMIESEMLAMFPDFVLSACTFCSFSQICGGGEAVRERWKKYPDEAAEAAYLEFCSISLNYKQTLDIGGDDVFWRGMISHEAWEIFNHLVNTATWKVYSVRRIRGLNIPYRSTKVVFVGTRTEAEAHLVELSKQYNSDLKYCKHDIGRVHLEMGDFENCEEYFVAAPGEPIEKQRNKFEDKWLEATKQILFDVSDYETT